MLPAANDEIKPPVFPVPTVAPADGRDVRANVNNIWKCPVQVTSELSGVACPLQARWSNGRWRVTCHQG